MSMQPKIKVKPKLVFVKVTNPDKRVCLEWLAIVYLSVTTT